MKRHSLLLTIALTGTALAQGPLTAPPGIPGPEMKSLQQIWDKIGGLETQAATQQEVIRRQNILIEQLAQQSGISFPWKISVVASGTEAITHHSLSIAPTDVPCVAFSTSTLRMARLVGGTWQLSYVDAPAGAGKVGAFCSLRHEPVSGRACIAYYDEVNEDLKFARENGAGWDISEVETAGNVGLSCSLAFGPGGSPSIACYDSTNSQLRIYSAPSTDGPWQGSNVAAATANQLGISLVMGSSGKFLSRVDLSGSPAVRIYSDEGGTWILIKSYSGFVQDAGTLGFSALGRPMINLLIANKIQISERISGLWQDKYAGYQVGTYEGISTAYDLLQRPRFAIHGGNPRLAFSQELKLTDPGEGLDYSAYSPVLVSSQADLRSSLAFNSRNEPAISFCAWGATSISFAARQPAF